MALAVTAGADTQVVSISESREYRTVEAVSRGVVRVEYTFAFYYYVVFSMKLTFLFELQLDH